MKKLLLIAVCTLIAFSSKAQSNTDEVALVQSVYGMNKQQLISDHMNISTADSAKFWSIYEKYEISRKALGQARIANIQAYANSYAAMTEETAKTLVKAALKNHMDFAKLQEKSFNEMAKAIGAIRAAQWIQIEVYLETVIRMQIADAVPLLDSIDPVK